VAAQVKHYTAPIGAPEIQQLRGAAHGIDTVAFYTLTGYTPAALAFAESAEVALFTYNVYGGVFPVNDLARELVLADR
jgi:hypothetical protein